MMENKKTVCITGGMGGLGIALANYLADFVYLDVVVLDKNEKKGYLNEKVKFIQCDLSSSGKYFQNIICDADYIFHLACIKPSERGTTEEEYQKNIKMTENVAKFNKKAKVVYASAGTIYGICDKFPIKEEKEVKCAENDWYCRGKLESENILKEYSEKNGWELVILRITNIYGINFRREGEVLPNFFEAIIRRAPLIIFGDGKQKRDRIFIDDLVKILVLSLKEGVQGVINVGSGKSYSTLKVAKMMGKILGKKYKVEFLENKSGERKNNLLDITKMKKVLNFKPKVSFKEGLKIVLRDWINHVE